MYMKRRAVILKHQQITASPGGPGKTRFLGPILIFADPVGSGWGPRICISNKFPGGTALLGPHCEVPWNKGMVSEIGRGLEEMDASGHISSFLSHSKVTSKMYASERDDASEGTLESPTAVPIETDLVCGHVVTGDVSIPQGVVAGRQEG